MKNKINYVGIIAALVMVVAVFLPWISTKAGEYGGESVTGFSFDDVKISPLISLVGAFVAFKRIRWAVILIGIINLLHGLLHLALYKFVDNLYSNASNNTVGFSPGLGLIIFLIAALVFIFSAKKQKDLKPITSIN